MSEQNKELIRRSFETFDDPSRVREFFAEDWQLHDVPEGTPQGPDAVADFINAVRAGFPDLSATLEDVFAEGDRVASRWRLEGTHTREYFGAAPTNKHVVIRCIGIDRIAGGRIVESWIQQSSQGFYFEVTGQPLPQREPATP